MEPFVSIIIPAYNVQNYIHRAIQSCLSQTYKKIEIIIIDDGSIDNTWQLISDYQQQDSRIKAYHQSNSGVSSARNLGIEKACGDYQIFLDSDDWLEKNAIEELLTLQSCNSQKLVCADYFSAYYNQYNEIEKEPNKLDLADAQKLGIHALREICSGDYELCSSCYKLFSSDIIHQYDMKFDISIHHGEDGLFVFEYLTHVDGFVYRNIPLWNILDRPGSATTGGYNAKWLTAIHAVEKMIAMVVEQELKDNLKGYLVERALTVEHTALQLDTIPKNDITFIRSKMKPFGRFYFTNCGLYHKIYYFLMNYAPPRLLQLYIKNRNK